MYTLFFTKFNHISYNYTFERYVGRRTHNENIYLTSYKTRYLPNCNFTTE